MPLISWDDSLSVGIDAIDRDHKMLLSIINDYGDAVTEGRQPAEISSIFSRLIAYSQYHFSREEEYMRAANYPHLERHIEQHNRFITTLTDLRHRSEVGDPQGPVELLDLLNDWLIDHIMKSDAQYAPFLAAAAALPRS